MTHQFDPTSLREYDIRGIVGKALGPADAVAIGRGFATRIRAGAAAVQIYSALIYEGPGLVGRIKRDLAGCLRRDGFSTVDEAIVAGPLTER